MACKGSHCTNHCYSYGCGEGTHRAPSSGNLFTFDNIAKEGKITANFTKQLKTALNSELSTRTKLRGYPNQTVGFTDPTKDSNILAKTNAEVLVELKNKINAIVTHSTYKAATGATGGDGGTLPTLNDTYNAGTIVTLAHWSNIRDKILALMRECLCNGNCGYNSICSCYNDCGCNYSDERLKEVRAEESVSSLEDFNKIKSKKWVYNLDKEHEHFGPIAQDIEAVYPEAIREDEMGYKMLDKTSMIGLLWGALNKSIDKINDLEARIEELEKK
jgi:hypothetical protein